MSATNTSTQKKVVRELKALRTTSRQSVLDRKGGHCCRCCRCRR